MADKSDESTFDLPGGGRMWRWTDGQGQRWICVDEGPPRPVDDFLAEQLENVYEGKVDLADDPDRGLLFRLTQKGQAAVEGMLQTSPEAVAIWGQIQRDLDRG